MLPDLSAQRFILHKKVCSFLSQGCIVHIIAEDYLQNVLNICSYSNMFTHTFVFIMIWSDRHVGLTDTYLFL